MKVEQCWCLSHMEFKNVFSDNLQLCFFPTLLQKYCPSHCHTVYNALPFLLGKKLCFSGCFTKWKKKTLLNGVTLFEWSNQFSSHSVWRSNYWMLYRHHFFFSFFFHSLSSSVLIHWLYNISDTRFWIWLDNSSHKNIFQFCVCPCMWIRFLLFCL